MASAERKIILKRIAHVYYIHEDLEKADQFLRDFGIFQTRNKLDPLLTTIRFHSDSERCGQNIL
jgi:hypothetical protein